MSDLNLRIAISIHALREEGDAGPAFPRCRPAISIHALREEGDVIRASSSITICEFLSTPSARRATIAPPPLRGVPDISIHALREEGDGILPDLKGTTSEFLSTPSARRATGYDPEAALDI